MKKIFSHKLRVRYEETDRMGVVYYGNYLIWLEIARTEMFREIGMPYTQLEKRGMYLMVVGCEIKYRSPVTYDDLIEIRTELSGLKNTSIGFSYEIFLDNTLVARASTAHAFTDTLRRPLKIPEDVRKVLSGLV